MGSDQSQIVEIDHKTTMIGDTAEKHKNSIENNIIIENNRNEHIIEMKRIKTKIDHRLDDHRKFIIDIERMVHSVEKDFRFIRFSIIIMIIMLTFLIVMLTFVLITRKE